jgi:hypothetical protein
MCHRWQDRRTAPWWIARPSEELTGRSRAPSARRGRRRSAEVWDQVDDAARLADSLHADGRAVRFDVHKLDGGVVASLVDENGGFMRPLLLDDVVDVGKLTEIAKEH